MATDREIDGILFQEHFSGLSNFQTFFNQFSRALYRDWIYLPDHFQIFFITINTFHSIIRTWLYLGNRIDVLMDRLFQIQDVPIEFFG